MNAFFTLLQQRTSVPSLSTPDSLDWKEPTPEEIVKKVTGNVRSGSIVLFHNDLANTTEALPQVLEQLSAQGYEFVPVSELIYTENYSIDANGMQIPLVQSATDITPENVDEVIAQYSDQLKAAGFTEDQLAIAAQAVRNGADVPKEVCEALAAMQVTTAEAAPVTSSAPENVTEGQLIK